MFFTIYSLLTTKNPNLLYLKWVLILALLILAILLYKYLRPPPLLNEGFTQEEPFVVKLNDEALDRFYVELYDTLHGVDDRTNLELSHIIQTTSPDTKNSVFLDVGSGTAIKGTFKRDNSAKVEAPALVIHRSDCSTSFTKFFSKLKILLSMLF